ncbi:MAG: hypothetical protein L6R42_005817 [Xanthoria sp. 1 TBL-2021]|nr:MAG: hypothetical protein L6R42_005817 [Xanthoria sp. 1 TBL-2021]
MTRQKVAIRWRAGPLPAVPQHPLRSIAFGVKMYFTSSSLVLIPALLLRLAASIPAEHQEPAYLATCNRDNLYRSFIDPRYSSLANAFCLDLLRPTISTVLVAAKTHTATATLAKRSLPPTTAFPPSRLSSVCSCILTTTPEPTTIYTSTETIIQPTSKTASPSSSCTDTAPIIKNSNFETGSLPPWTILSSDPDLKYYAQYFSYSVTSPGHNSAYAFTMTDDLADTYVAVEIGQTISLCPNRTYKISAQVFITDGGNTPTKEQFAELYVDDLRVAEAPESYVQGPPVVWKVLGGEFVSSAEGGTAVVKVRFVATNLVAARWGVDDVVVVAV